MTTISVCFYNNGKFDKRSFTMLGLSAKSSDDAIGFFGTGFKYAIATLLRHGYGIRVCDGKIAYNFHTANATFRDKEYTAIHCITDEGDVTELPFTTHLGANWKLWQAYRELFTNAKDEGGGVCLTDDEDPLVAPGDICVHISGDHLDELINIYRNHDKYFLDQPDLVRGTRLRAVAKKIDSDNVVYYKTMYTGTKLDRPTFFTYDYVTTTELTEDRTLADTWYLRTHIGELWVHSMTFEQLITYLPMIKSDYYEHNLEAGYKPPSEDFIKACAYLNKHHKAMPMWARDVYSKTLPFDKQIEPYAPTKHQAKKLQRAITILHHHRCMVDASKVVLCSSLPDELLGFAADGVIYISKTVFEESFEKLLGTLYEEYVHNHYRCSDMTRTMQNILIDRVASLMLEVYDMESEV